MQTARTEFVAEAGSHAVVMTRVFDAPRERMFKVYTDPLLIPQWWGTKRLTTVVDKIELKPGGVWRYVQRGADGDAFAFHGVYHEIAPPKRMVSTLEFEGVAAQVVLETATFEELEGKTRVTNRSVFQAVEDREGMVRSCMEQGALETMERLAELVTAPDTMVRR